MLIFFYVALRLPTLFLGHRHKYLCTLPPKKKARKVRHVDEVTTPEHGLRQCQEHERFVTPDGGEIDEVADRIYVGITRSVQGGERR